jgi:hypothetical protein
MRWIYKIVWFSCSKSLEISSCEHEDHFFGAVDDPRGKTFKVGYTKGRLSSM